MTIPNSTNAIEDMRNPLVVANWKLNGDTRTVADNVRRLCRWTEDNAVCRVVVAPPLVYLDLCRRLRRRHRRVLLAAQNVDTHLRGAFTGETSVLMLKDLGVRYVILGHGERRRFHHETDDDVVEKFVLVQQAGLIPLLCIGEDERSEDDSLARSVCARQIRCVLNAQRCAFRRAVVAYEPIWAIGSKHSPSCARIQRLHAHIRRCVSAHDSNSAQTVVLLYGGSVDARNASRILACPDVDGLLVGRSSLDAEDLIRLMERAARGRR